MDRPEESPRLRSLLVATADKPTARDVIARARARVDATGVRLDAGAIPAATVDGQQRRWRTRICSHPPAYVALAEILAVQLVTLDQRLRRGPGITRSVSVPGVDH